MAEFSIFWTTGTSGDGTSTYTQTQLTDWLRRTFNAGANQGVLKGYANGLAVSGVATPVSVETGAASVYGFPYENSAVVTVAIPTPSVSTRIDRIVLRADWAAHTVRITRIAGTEGGAAPALTQTPGTTYDIPLAQAVITTGGVITVYDDREWLRPNIMVPSDFEGGWVDCQNEDWIYVSPTSFNVPTDKTAKYRKGVKIRLKQGGAYKYFYGTASSYAAPFTTVTVNGGSDFSLANAAITDNYISFIENPEGFPEWFNWAPSIVGYSVVPTSVSYRFRIRGRAVTLHMTEATDGTSNATNLTYSLPITATSVANKDVQALAMRAKNNGTEITQGNGKIFAASPTVLSCYSTYLGGGWTASGAKIFAQAGFQIEYEMA